MAQLDRKTAFDWRDHVGAEAVALSLLFFASAAFAAWSASRMAQGELDERTRARLLPRKHAIHDSGGQ